MKQSVLCVLITTCIFERSAFVRGDDPLDLGVAAAYAVLAGSTVTSTGVVGTVINGNIGLYPGTSVVGFPPGIVDGTTEAANAAASDAQTALTTAYLIGAAKASDSTLSNLDLGGMTLVPGVYKFDATAALNGMLTLDASSDNDAVWTIQTGTTLSVAGGGSVIFKDNIGNPDHVYWVVGSSATLGGGSSMIGNIMALESITLGGAAVVRGRCLARNAAVTLDNNLVSSPSKEPTASPSTAPTQEPTVVPSVMPSAELTLLPTIALTTDPSAEPSMNPSESPTVDPTAEPSAPPTASPTTPPTLQPSAPPGISAAHLAMLLS